MKKLAVFMLVYLTHLSFSRAQNITVSGYIYNQKTKGPVPLVNVSIVGNQHLRDDQTDSEGFFTITLKNGIKEGGLVRLRAAKEGFETIDVRIVVSSLKPVTLYLSPQSKPRKEKKSAGKPSPLEEAIGKLIQDLKNENDDIRMQACRELGRIGEPAKAAANPLTTLLLHDENFYIRSAAATNLGKIGLPSAEVKKSLYLSLKDHQSPVRKAASRSLLSSMKSAGELEPLACILKNEDVDSVTKAAIVKLGEGAVPVLKKILQSDPVNKVWMLQPLVHLAPDFKNRLFPYVAKGLSFETYTEDEYYYWLEIIHSITDYDLKASDELSLLSRIILENVGSKFSMKAAFPSPDEFDNNVKAPALQILLTGINKIPEVALPLLVAIINNCDSKFYGIVVQKVLAAGMRPENEAVLTKALWERHIERHNLGYGIYDILQLAFLRHKLNAAFLPEMVKWFNELGSAEQLDILDLLNDYDPKAAVPLVMVALKKDAATQLAAVTCLQRMGPRAVVAVPVLAEMKKTTGDAALKLEIEKALKAIEGN